MALLSRKFYYSLVRINATHGYQALKYALYLDVQRSSETKFKYIFLVFPGASTDVKYRAKLLSFLNKPVKETVHSTISFSR